MNDEIRERIKANVAAAKARKVQIQMRRFVPTSPEVPQQRGQKPYKENPHNQECPKKEDWWNR